MPETGTLSTHNQWRCEGNLTAGKKCHKLLALTDSDHHGLFIMRRDLKVYIYEAGGSGILVVCRSCGASNWLFSDSVSQETRDGVTDYHSRAKF